MLDVSALANRLAKNWKHYGKWARRQGIEAWRVYDRDIPEFPWTIDRYGERILITEIESPESQETEEMPISLQAQLHIRESTAPPRPLPAATGADRPV